MEEKYIKEYWDKITHFHPNLNEDEFIEIITQPGFDIDGYVISKNISREENYKLDRWYGNHKDVLKNKYEYMNSEDFQKDLDDDKKIKDRLKEVYKKKRIGVLYSHYYENKMNMKKVMSNLFERYGKDNIQIVSSVIKYGIGSEVKKFSLDMGLDYVDFPPRHHQPTPYTINPLYQYGKGYHPMNFRDCFFEVIDYSNGILIFNTKGQSGWWIKEVVEKCEEDGKFYRIIN